MASEDVQPLRILLLEDSEIDAELVTSHLRKSHLPWTITRAAKRAEFLRALDCEHVDIVLADYSLPDFDGLSALDIVRERCSDLPFIFVSGVVGEEFAINALRRGATDYVMKRGLSRLPAALERAIAEARERQERQRAQHALRLSETSAQLAVEAAGLGKWEYDPQTHQFQWDARCRELFGLPASSAGDVENLLSLCHLQDRERLDRTLRETVLTGTSDKIYEECRIVRPTDRDERWLSFSGCSLVVDGHCARFIGVVADITERKRSETALQEINETLRIRVARQIAERDHLWQLSQDLLAVIDPSGTLIEANPAWSLLLGQDRVTIGQRLIDLAHPEDVATVVVAVTRASYERLRRVESRFVCADGTARWISWSAAPGHGCIYVVGRDVTEDKEAEVKLAKAEEALRQSQKMEAVGHLTGGVAHDFNNLLQIVIGNLDTLQRKLPPDLDRMHRAADHAMAGARRAASLTQRLLAFSRRQPLNPRPFDVNGLVAGMTDLLQRTLGELIEIETDLDPELWSVEIDANQLESAVLNLAVNARDAMPSGGTLSIQTGNEDVRDPHLATELELTPGDYVVIRVVDTGAGMPPDVLDRVFEPFFTTKSAGHGTGLGLSQVYGFVTQSGGSIKITSQVEVGTCVCIYLPRHLGIAQQTEEQSPLEAPMSLSRETVLVVEDDPDVRGYTVEAVRALGYHVLEARDGPSALKILSQKHPGSIDLLFSDVVLPGGLDGHSLSMRALELHPQMKVLFATGYAHDVIVHHGRLDPGVQLIAKPFAFHDLASRLRSVLDTPAHLRTN
ncbi:MAG: response regulator [Steroidobacteraceae bacterium]